MLSPEHHKVLDNFAKHVDEIRAIVDFIEGNELGIRTVVERKPEEIKEYIKESELNDGLEEMRSQEKRLGGTTFPGPVSLVDSIFHIMESAERFRVVYSSELLKHLYKHFGIDTNELEMARRALLEEQRALNEEQDKK